MVVHLWSIRPPNEKEYDYQAIYEGKTNLFSIRIHHGGVFTKYPGRRYVSGKVSYVDFLDMDLFSIHELNDIVQELGYLDQEPMFYHFEILDKGLDFGLHALGSDQDVHYLSKFVDFHKIINVYIEHGKTMLDNYYCSPHSSKVVIEEINEVEPVEENKQIKACKRLLLEWHNEEPSTGGCGGLKKLNIRSQSKGKGISQEEVSKNTFDWNDLIVDYEPFTNEVVQNDENEQRIEVESDPNGDSTYDSDYIVDEDNDIDEVEVDMRDFQAHVDSTVEFMGPKNNIEEDELTDDAELDVIDNEDFDTASDSGDDIHDLRAKRIRNLKKQKESGVVYRYGFYVGQVFPNSDVIKDMIKRHAVETRRELKIIKNDKLRIRAICMGPDPTQIVVPNEGGVGGPSQSGALNSDGVNVEKVVDETKKLPNQSTKEKSKGKDVKNRTCPWTLLVSKAKKTETWQVKTLHEEHKCLQSRNPKACTAGFLSAEIVDVIESNPEIPVKALQHQLQKKFEVGVSRMKAFRAKAHATIKLKGDYTTQYGMLRDYCLEVHNNNPGSTIKIEVEDAADPNSTSRQFKRIYICLGPLKQGFKACMRDLLGLDGCFMKGPYPGQLLTAVGLDANNGIYPVAYALVEAETTLSWTWFLECLGDDLDLSTRSNFTFISDRQKGIIPAIAKVFPCAEHRFCLRHIHENMKQKWKGRAYKDFLWKSATALTVQQFQHEMAELRNFNVDAANWLSQIPPQHWARSHFSGRAHSDVLLNNLCEVLNRQLVDGRDKPIITALEYVREYLMKRIVNVQLVIEKSDGPLTPTATKLFESIKKDVAQYNVIWNGGSKYQVSGPWMDQCVVDITEKICTCRKWELTGIPCKHVVATIWDMSMNGQQVGLPESWVDQAYWLDTWKKTYSFKIGHINGRNMWPKSQCPTTLTAPRHHKPIGRPRKKRRKGIDEKESMDKGGKLSRAMKTVTCGKCKKEGHNSRTCVGQGGATRSGQ